MDLGCIDMGCAEKKQTEEASSRTRDSPSSSASASFKAGKFKALKDPGQTNLGVLSRFTSQIKKPPNRRTSPINWFPRKKVDSYLKRKIKLLQEVGGMNSSLDETLGDANPHYSKVLREKIAVREAVQRAIEARKGAMVEASWCRILKASRINATEAESKLVEAEKVSAEAFEAATALGVTLYDIADCPQKHYKIETSLGRGGGFTTHTVSTYFETAFEVDKQVAAAVKCALVRLANCPSMDKDGVKELLRKISENPAGDVNYQDFSEPSSGCESATSFELGYGDPEDGFASNEVICEKELRQKKIERQQVSEKYNSSNITDMIFDRLKCLQENELASLATIVATCGLNAALAEAERTKHAESDPAATFNLEKAVDASSQPSSLGTGTTRTLNVGVLQARRKSKMVEEELPSLDKFLVKRLTKLERDVLEAKNLKRNEAGGEETKQRLNSHDHAPLCLADNSLSEQSDSLESDLLKPSSKFEREIKEAREKSETLYGDDKRTSNSETISCETISKLGSALAKHSSKFEKEIEEAKRLNQPLSEAESKKLQRGQEVFAGYSKEGVTEFPSLDKFLVKHVSRLEREVQEAKDKRNMELTGLCKGATFTSKNSEKTLLPSGRDPNEKENFDVNKNNDSEMGADSLNRQLSFGAQKLEGTDKNRSGNCQDRVLQLQRPISCESSIEISRSLPSKNGEDVADSSEGLEKILVKHVSRLEKEKMGLHSKENMITKVKRRDTKREIETNEGSLDQVLVRHTCRIEREKIAAVQQPNEQARHSVTRREAREKEMQEAWGGLSLGNSMRPHVSGLEKTSEGSLDQVLVRHKSRIEQEKIAAVQQQSDEQARHSVTRREAREKELQEAWGGLSLGNSMRPHVSKLERDKAAWLRAEEEERRRGMQEL